MADGNKVQYWVEVALQDSKLKEQLSKWNWKDIMGLDDLSDVFSKEGNEAVAAFNKAIASTDIDWEKVLGSKAFKKEINAIIQGTNDAMRSKLGKLGDKELKAVSDFVAAVGTAAKESGVSLNVAANSITAFAKSIKPLEGQLDKLAEAFQIVADRMGQINGKKSVVMPSFDTTDASKQVSKYAEEVKELNGLLDDLSKKKTAPKGSSDALASKFAQVRKQADELSDEIDDLMAKTEEVGISADEDRQLRLEIAKKKAQRAKLHLELQKIDDAYVVKSTKENTLTSLMKQTVVEDAKEVAKEAKKYINDLISELTQVTASETKMSGESIDISVRVPTAEDIRIAVNEEIKKLNKRKNALQAVKLTIDDSIDSSNNSTVEKTADTVSKSFEKIDNVIETKTSQWREKIINAFKLGKKEIDVPFTAEASAEIVFNQVQQFFEENEIELRLNKDAIVQQLKQAIEEGGLPAGGIGGGGTVSLDPKTLVSAFATGLQAFFTGDFTPVTGEKKTVKEVQEKPKKAFYLDPQNEHNQEVAKTFKEVLDYALVDKAPNKKVRGFIESKLVGSEFWDEEAKSVNLDKLVNGSSIGLVSALSYITEKYGETLIDDVDQLIKDTGKNKLLSNFRSDVGELLRTQNIKQITGDEHTNDLEREKLWRDYVKKGSATSGIGKLMGSANANIDDLKLPEIADIENLISLVNDFAGKDALHEIHSQVEAQHEVVVKARREFHQAMSQDALAQIRSKQAELKTAIDQNDDRKASQLRAEIEALELEEGRRIEQQIKEKKILRNQAKATNNTKQVAELEREVSQLEIEQARYQETRQKYRVATSQFSTLANRQAEALSAFKEYAPIVNALETLRDARSSITDVNNVEQKQGFLTALSEFKTNVQNTYWDLRDYLKSFEWGIDVKGFKKQFGLQSASGVDRLWRAIGGDESRITKPHLYRAPDSISGLVEQRPDRTDILYRDTKVTDFKPRENTSKRWEEPSSSKDAEDRIQKIKQVEQEETDALNARQHSVETLTKLQKAVDGSIEAAQKELNAIQKSLGLTSFKGKSAKIGSARRRLGEKRSTVDVREAEYQQYENERLKAIKEQEDAEKAVEDLIKKVGADNWVVQSARDKAQEAANRTAEATKKAQEAKVLFDQAQNELDTIQNDEWVRVAALLDTLKFKRENSKSISKELDKKLKELEADQPKSAHDRLAESTEDVDSLIEAANKAQENLNAAVAEAKQIEQWVDDTISGDGYKKTEYNIGHTNKNQKIVDESKSLYSRSLYLSRVADGTFKEGEHIPDNITDKISQTIDSLTKSREILQKLSLDFGLDGFISEDELKKEISSRLANNAQSETKFHPIIQEYYQKIVNEGREAASRWLSQTLESTRTDIETQTGRLQSFAEADSQTVKALKPKLDEADAHLRETYQKRVKSWFNAIDKKMKIVEKGEAEGATDEAKRAGALAAKEIENIYTLINRAIREYTSKFTTSDFYSQLTDLRLKYRELPLTEEAKNDPAKRKEIETQNEILRQQLAQAIRELKESEHKKLEQELLADNQPVIENRNRNLYSDYVGGITASSRASADTAHSVIESSERYNLLLTRQSELLAEISSATLDGKNTDELQQSLVAINDELLKYQHYLTNINEDIIKMEQKVALDRALGVPKEELDKQYADIDKARADAEKAQYEGLKKRQTDLLAQIKADTKEGKSTEALSLELKNVNEELLRREATQRRLEQLGASGDLYRADVRTVEEYNALIEQQIKLEQELALIKARGEDATEKQQELRKKRNEVRNTISRYQEARIRGDAENSPYVQALDYLRETQEQYETALQKRYAIKGRRGRLERQLDDVQNDETYSTSWQYRKHQTEVKNRFVSDYVASDQYKTDRLAGFETVEKEFSSYLTETFGADRAKEILYEFMRVQLDKRADKIDPNSDKFTEAHGDMMRDGLIEGRINAENEFKSSQAYQDLLAQREAILKPYQDALAQAYDDIKNGRDVGDADLQQKIDAIDRELADNIVYLTEVTTEDYPLLEAEVKKLLEGADPKNNREYEAIVEKARNNLIQQERQRALELKNAEAYKKLQPAVAVADQETQVMLQDAIDDYVREYFDNWIKKASDKVFETSGSKDVTEKFKALLEENVYNLVSHYAESLVVKNGKLNGVDIRAEVEKRIQDQIDILNQHGVETEQDIANIEKQRRAAMQFGGIKTGEITDAEVLREQAVLEGRLTLEKERQKELTDEIARLEKEGASSDELGKLGAELDRSNENIRKLEMFVANKDVLMEIQHQALKDEKVLEQLDLDQQKLYYEARKTAAEADLESGNEKVRKSAEERLIRLNSIIERLDGKIAERDQAERDARNPIKMFASAIKEALGGQGGGLNIDATGLATEATLAQILAVLTGGKVVEGSARSEVAATIDKKSPEWKALQAEANKAYSKVKNTKEKEWKPEEKTAIENVVKSLIEKIQDPKVDEKSKIALQVALKDALSDFASSHKGDAKLNYKANGQLSYEEMDKYFGYAEGTLKNLRLTDAQARAKLSGQGGTSHAQPKAVDVGDGGVNALARQDTLSKILEVLNAFKSNGVKVTGKKQGEAKAKEPKVEKTEAELIKERALKDKDAVLGIAANSKVKKKYEQLVKQLESESDLGKIKALAQKTSALGFNIKKESAEWDYKTADANRVYNIPNANLFGKRKETVRKSMEKLAQTQFNPDGKQYEFLNFDGKQLVYQLTDVRGNVEKVTMEWSELNNQVAITSDKSVSKLDGLASKIEAFGGKFENAIDAGYLGDKDKDLKKFQDAVAKINAEISNGASFETIDKLRNEALRLADIVDKKVAKTKRSYSGTTEINAVNRQRDNMGSSGILDKENIALVKEYNASYDALMKKFNRFKNNGTLFNPKNQKTLQEMALHTKSLGKDLEKAANNSQRLKEAMRNSGTFNGQEIGAEFKVADDVDVYDQMVAKLKELGAEHIKVDRVRKIATGTIRHNNTTVSDLTVEYDKLRGSLARYQKQERESLTGLPAFINGFQKKFNSIMQYLTMTMSIHQVMAQLRQGVQYVKEIDLALTELRKVTDETEESYERFLETASKTAEKVGSTIQKVVSSTADWARLGYSMKKAAELAESTQILLNVSEFTDVSAATDSLISTVQAFKYTAEESMSVVDILNTIGNNYAISTADLAQSLTKSSSALVAANGTLEEAVALTAAANTTIQDADVVGTALKTISMRLRGTSLSEMEEDGLDTEGYTTRSKLRGTVKSVTGIDILTDTGAYKSTYQILAEIAEVWDDITDDKARAGLLEALAGKRSGSVVAAILQNPDVLKNAFESAKGAQGSAQAELEKYMDSIQGRLDQFTNSLQTMWNNVLDDDLIKFIVQAGTELLKFIDSLGVVKTLVIGIGTYLIQKNFKGDLFGGIFNAQTVDEARDRLKNLQADVAKLQKEGKSPKKIERKQNQADTLKASIDKYDELSKQLAKNRIDADAAKKALDDYNESLAKKYSKKKNQGKSPTDDETAKLQGLQKAYDDANNEIVKTEADLKQAEVQAKKTGTAGFISGNKIKAGFKAGWKAVKKFGKEMLSSMAYTMAITAVFEAIGNIGNALAPLFKNMDKSAEALQEKLSELENELSAVESELSNLKSELKDTDERIEELMSQGSLTFVEQEELNKLKSVSAELKAQIGLQETLQKSLQQGVNSASIDATNAYLDTSFMSEKSKSERQEKGKETGEGVGQIVGTALGALGFLTGNPLIGAALMAAGSTLGSTIGGWIGEGIVGAVYDSEQSVGEAMDNMLVERDRLLQGQKDALASGDAEAYNEATEALRTYDSQMAKHISQIQQNYNAMDWATASPEDRKEMMEYADWLDKYNISMGTAGAKSNAIARIFGDEASEELKEIKKRMQEAADAGEEVSLADAFNGDEDAYNAFKARLYNIGLTVYETEQYFKNEKEAAEDAINSIETYDAIKQIQKLTGGVNSLKNAFKELREEGIVSAETLLGLEDVFGDTDGWDAFFETMSSGTATMEEAEESAKTLAENYVDELLSSGKYSAKEYVTYISHLQSLGITNAREFLDAKLKKNMAMDIAQKVNGGMSESDAIEAVEEEYGIKLDGENDMLLIEKAITAEKTKQEALDKQASKTAYDNALIVQNAAKEKNEWLDGQIKSVTTDLSDSNYSLYSPNQEIADKYGFEHLSLGYGQYAYNYKGVTYRSTAALQKAIIADLTSQKVEVPSLPAEVTQIDVDNANNAATTAATALQTELDSHNLVLNINLIDPSELVDEAQNIYDTLANAAKEYDESGYVSVDTLQSLLQLEPKYLALLYDENGQLSLNKETMYQLTVARVTDMGIQQAQQVIETARTALLAGNTDKLRELTEVTYGQADANWSLVTSNLALLKTEMEDAGVDDGIYQGIEDQVFAIQNLTNTTIANIGNTISSSGNTAAAEVEDAFKALMDYWDNRISANQAKYDQIQNDIDYLEAQGKMADANYYKDQIALLTEGEESKQAFLEAKLQGAADRLRELEAAGQEGSDEWFRKKPAYLETYKRNPLNCWNFLRALYTTTQG